MTKDFFNKNNIEYLENVSLKKYNTYRVECIANFIVFPKNEEELLIIIKYIKDNNIKSLVLGNGSNVIFANEKFNGIIIKLDRLNELTYNKKTVTAGAGYSLIKLSLDTIENGLSGLEFASGIPGCVGASVAMNVGAYNCELSKVIKSVKVITPNLEIKEMKPEELDFSYRDSFLKRNKDFIVLSATFELEDGDKEEMKKTVKEKQEKRISSQPLEYPNAGSVFRNPEGMYTGELVEKLNLKGYNINNAEISTKHANFIINKGNAKGKDIVALIEKIKKEVKNNYNVDLVLEQIIIK